MLPKCNALFAIVPSATSSTSSARKGIVGEDSIFNLVPIYSDDGWKSIRDFEGSDEAVRLAGQCEDIVIQMLNDAHLLTDYNFEKFNIDPLINSADVLREKLERLMEIVKPHFEGYEEG